MALEQQKRLLFLLKRIGVFYLAIVVPFYSGFVRGRGFIVPQDHPLRNGRLFMHRQQRCPAIRQSSHRRQRPL